MRWMLFVTLYTLKVLEVGTTTLFEGGHDIIMARSASLSSGPISPYVYSGFMRTVTRKAVFDGQIFRVFLMAVRTLVIPAFCQTVPVVTVVAVLLGVSTGIFIHVLAWLCVTCQAAWLHILQFRKVNDYRGVRIMASLAVVEFKVSVRCRIMTHTAFRDDNLACRWMPLVAVKASYRIPVG
jgi:hypothetical protein